MNEVTITELARGLSDFINRATYRRKEFLITRGGKPVAALSPVPSGVRIGDLEQTLAALPDLSPGDAARFEADLAQLHRAQNEPVTDPWPSS